MSNLKENVNPNAPQPRAIAAPQPKSPTRASGVQTSARASSPKKRGERAPAPAPVPVLAKPGRVAEDKVLFEQLTRAAQLNAKHLDDPTLKDLHVEFHPGALDFNTGHISKASQGVRYFSPVAVDLVKEYLSVTGGLACQHDYYADVDSMDSEPMRYSPRGEAESFFNMVITHLACTEDDSCFRSILGDMVKWSDIGLDCHLLDRRRAKHHNWKASYVMHYFLKHYNSNGKFVSKEDHPDYPHVVACVADDAPIVPNALSHAELNAVMVLGSFAAGDADEAGRTRRSAYPVSIISGSERDFRVLQAAYHPVGNTFKIVSSEIVRFNEGIDANREEYLKLLGWVIADLIEGNPMLVTHRGVQK